MTSDSLSLPRTTRKSKLKTRAKEATLWATTNSQLGQKMNMPHSSEEVMRKEEISLREKEPENVVLEETHAHLLSQNLHQNQSCQLLSWLERSRSCQLSRQPRFMRKLLGLWFNCCNRRCSFHQERQTLETLWTVISRLHSQLLRLQRRLVRLRHDLSLRWSDACHWLSIHWKRWFMQVQFRLNSSLRLISWLSN